MARRMLTDELWSKLREILRQHRIYDKPLLRKMVEGILYRMRVGCPGEIYLWNLDVGIQYFKNLIVGLHKTN